MAKVSMFDAAADFLENVGEANEPHNDRQRRIIAAMKEEHGEAWLGLLNPHGGRKGPILVQWDGVSLVYNFGADLVVPREDEVLMRLIRERDEAPYTGVTADSVRVKAIQKRVRQLGGYLLVWS